jgi:hypothetical protein
MLVDPKSEALPLGHVMGRGFTAAHGVLLGALYLFLLHAPLQVLSAVAQGFQGRAMVGPGQQPDLNQVLLSLSLSCGALLFGLAVFFLFPLVQGGILGQVRDRLESPRQPPGEFGTYGRTFYVRLLGSQGLFVLVGLVLMLPALYLGVSVALQEMAKSMPTGAAEAPPPPDPQQLTRQLLLHPAFLAGTLISSVLMSAAGMVYWLANCMVVAERERVLPSWRKSLRFCRQNFSAVLAVWLVVFALGLLVSPVPMVGQLGVVKETWALVALALFYAGLVGYLGVLLAGLVLSLYLARRPHAHPLQRAGVGAEPVPPSLEGAAVALPGPVAGSLQEGQDRGHTPAPDLQALSKLTSEPF